MCQRLGYVWQPLSSCPSLQFCSIQSTKEDWNRDTLADAINLQIGMPLVATEKIKQVTLLAFFKYQLKVGRHLVDMTKKLKLKFPPIGSCVEPGQADDRICYTRPMPKWITRPGGPHSWRHGPASTRASASAGRVSGPLSTLSYVTTLRCVLWLCALALCFGFVHALCVLCVLCVHARLSLSTYLYLSLPL